MQTPFYPHDNKARRRTWTWALIPLCLVFIFGGQILGLLPLKPFDIITRETVEDYPQFLYIMISAFGMIIVLLTLWIKYFEGLSLASAGLSFNSQSFKRFARGYGFGLLMGSAIVASVYLLGGYVIEKDYSLGTIDLLIILSLLIGFIIQSSAEEYVFRGWLMARLSERYGTIIGVLGNTALFSLLHITSDTLQDGWLMNIIFIAALSLFSILLSLYVIREKSIWGACAWHASWNAVFITFYGLPTTGIGIGIKPLLVDLMAAENTPLWLHGGSAGPEDSVFSSVVLVIGCLGVLMWKRRS